MKTVTTTTTVYNFNELSEKAKEKAIINHIEWIAEIGWENEEYRPSYIKEAIDKCEEMKTPWFFGDYIYEFGKDSIELELQDSLFTEDGELFTN